ncbi:hypothetical protein [Comamonas sp.]|uniref:deoxynucleotide monophosphate kinase family protein n=1 Tax=Comamonas sp. TaxID=34028 RepID=UPI00258315D3|nr:hypothetical protein [Comamonas sp.]
MKFTHTPTIIGLTGANGAGKDTVAAMLAAELHRHGKAPAVIAFADALYEEVSAAFNISVQALRERVTKEIPLEALKPSRCNDPGFKSMLAGSAVIAAWLGLPSSPRQILQWWGTEYRRKQQSDYWVMRLLQMVHGLRASGTSHIIITDVRFADEAEAIRHQGAQIWRVHRPNLLPTTTGHVSEVTGEEFAPESTILNCGSLDALRFSACQTLYRSSLRKPRTTA